MKAQILIALAVAWWPAPGNAQTVGTPDFDPLGEHLSLPTEVRVQVEFVEMAHEKLTALLMGGEDADVAEPRKGANDTDLRKKVSKMVRAGDAKIVETSIITTRSGQRAKVEAIAEMIYPTEYSFPDASDGKSDGDASDDPKSAKPAVMAPVPSAFEMRPVGTTFEVDPVVGADGAIVELNIAPEIVYNAGHTSYGKWKTPQAEVEMKQPNFYSIKFTTAVTVLSGQYHLVGVVTPVSEKTGRADTSKKVAVFLKADVIQVGK